MFYNLKNLKNKAKELISTVTHGKGVSKSIGVSKRSPFSYDIHDKVAAKSYVRENFPPYGESGFGYLENNVTHDFKDICDSRSGSGAYSYSCIGLDENSWANRQKSTNDMYNARDDKETLKWWQSILGGDVDSGDINRRSVILAGEVPQKIVKELYGMKSDKIKFAAIEENLDEDNCLFSVARLAIAGKDPVCLMDFLEASKCREYGVDAITICNKDENKTRGVRLTLLQDEDGQEIRSYEILNDSYDMTITWEVEGKKCQMDINVSADGSAKILKRNGVTDEEIYAHQEVMVGKEYDTKCLYEALGLNQGKSTEKVQPKLYKRSQPQKSKEIKELVEKNPEVESALKEFASEAKEESSESVKPLTDITKADVKGASSML